MRLKVTEFISQWKEVRAGAPLGLHAAADTIESGQRVLWASVDMPDAGRFSQLFDHLSLVESSRFHAMNFGGKFERAIDAMVEAVNALPSVGLVVMDDWCEASGRLDGERLRHIKRFSSLPKGHRRVVDFERNG